jgi:hypothetical protein
MKRAVTAFAVLAALTGGALAQEDASWPCIQRKQPHLSIGQLWTGPLPDDATAELARRADIAALAQVLEQRRLSLEAAEAQIAAFAETADAAELTALFSAIFERIDAYRGEIISGIALYAQKQTTLSAQIEARRQRMAELEATASPDFDLIDAEEAKLDWDTRIFTDRQQQLTYVCESPVLLEQRAFALAKAIAAHLPPVTPTPAP